MGSGVMSENKRYKPKKAMFKRLAVAFILIIAVVGGVYALLNKLYLEQSLQTVKQLL